jgi:hypothetical protein
MFVKWDSVHLGFNNNLICLIKGEITVWQRAGENTDEQVTKQNPDEAGPPFSSPKPTGSVIGAANGMV